MRDNAGGQPTPAVLEDATVKAINVIDLAMMALMSCVLVGGVVVLLRVFLALL